jgi:phage/plasmid-associated DNA primase
VAVGLKLLAELGFGRTELETVAAALGVGFRDRKVFVERLLNKYRQAEGSVRLFLSARCAVGEDLQVEAARLYEAYTEWCRQAGLNPLTRRKFGREMRGLGIPTCRRGCPGRLFYRGVGLVP